MEDATGTQWKIYVEPREDSENSESEYESDVEIEGSLEPNHRKVQDEGDYLADISDDDTDKQASRALDVTNQTQPITNEWINGSEADVSFLVRESQRRASELELHLEGLRLFL